MDDLNSSKKESREALEKLQEYNNYPYIVVNLNGTHKLREAINNLLNVNEKYDLVSCLNHVELTEKKEKCYS